MEAVFDLKPIRDATNLSLIATNRSLEQGGLCRSSEAERVKGIVGACEAGFDFVDIELTSGILQETVKNVKDLGVKLIISYHDLQATPQLDDLRKIVQGELRAGADICKIVGTAVNQWDGLTYLRFLQENSSIPLVCFGMGEAGIVSRIFSPLLGGAFTYATSGAGSESAAGQLTIAEMKTIYRILGV